MFHDDSAPETDMPGLAPDLLIRRAALVDRGVDADDIRRRLSRGEWQLIHRGVYARTVDFQALTRQEQHRLRIDATVPKLGDRYVISHQSAACLHGIELLRAPGEAVQVTDPSARCGHRRRLLHTFSAGLDADEITTVRGHRVTTVARTLIDVARTGGFDSGVVAADHALRMGWVDREQLLAAADRAARRGGMSTARQVVAFADPGAESVGESRSRILMDRQGVPAPELQFRIVDRLGGTIARTDFRWRAFNTVGEFDGAEKYGRRLRAGQRAGDAVFQEKVREDRIREYGFTVVRWTWSELDEPRILADKIRRALARGLAIAG